MKISVVQTDLTWEDKNANLLSFSRLITPLFGKTDLVILPETFSTGFTMRTADFAEPMKDRTFNWMKDLAIRGNFGICGSYIVEENGSYFNRFVFVNQCTEHFYDKRHLFSIGDEDKFFTRGSVKTVFRYMDFRICPFICYDLRFPVWSRNRNDYDLAIYAANWPGARIGAWNVLLRARAIENQCYVAASNRTGVDGEGKSHPGMSQIINARGEVIAAAGEEPEKVISAELSIEELTDFRQKFNVLRDSDNFTIH